MTNKKTIDETTGEKDWGNRSPLERIRNRTSKAKELLNSDERDLYLIEKAKARIIEGELEERIFFLRQEYEERELQLRLECEKSIAKLRDELRNIRTKNNKFCRSILSKNEESRKRYHNRYLKFKEKRRNNLKKKEVDQETEEQIEQARSLIKEMADNVSGVRQTNVFDLIPEEKRLVDDAVSYEEIAHLFNQKHIVVRNKKKGWNKTSVRRFIEDNVDPELAKKLGHKKNKQAAAKESRIQKADDFARLMRDNHLKYIDTTQSHLAIAKELNKKGVESSRGGKWSNVSVKRLLERIEALTD